MGGLYITPNSTEMGWKRRGLRVSSEALLCLGVATIVASFVVDVNADGSKPNIWILIGGVIMIMAAAIGWSLTFCLIWETIQADNNGSDQNPKAPVHSIQVVCPETDVNNKIDPTYIGGYSKPETTKQKTSRDKQHREGVSKDKKPSKSKGKSKKSSPSSSGKSSKYTKESGSSRSKPNKNSHTSSKTSRSSDYSRSTNTTNTTNSSSYTGTTSSSYTDSSSYTSSEQRKSYV